MQRTKKSPGAATKVKKKMTKEQMQLAIIKKKECDAKALNIVMQLLEPKVDPIWLIENLKDINRCHMEDVIEERAITKLCGYVLCQKPITIIMNQRYHISLKDKKVYDVTKRKNFCSSSCFGASNYLLEQMLTSPLWLRDKEEIPKFRIFTNKNLISNSSHGEEVDITIINPCSKDDVENVKETEDVKEEKKLSNDVEKTSMESIKEKISQDVQEFVNSFIHQVDVKKTEDIKKKKGLSNYVGTENNIEEINEKTSIESVQKEIKQNIEKCILPMKHKNVKKTNQTKNSETQLVTNNIEKDEKATKTTDETEISTKKVEFKYTLSENKQNVHLDTIISEIKVIGDLESIKNINQDENKESNSIEQCINFDQSSKYQANPELGIEQNQVNKEDIDDSTYVMQPEILLNSKTSQNNLNENVKYFENDQNEKNIDEGKSNQAQSSESQVQENSEKSVKTKIVKKKKQTKQKVNEVVNLAARVEQSFQEWITEETIHFLFGDDSVKQTAIEKIETQDRYSILCQKLNRLQFQDEQEDKEILEKPTLKPAPHFAVLQEEGQKLELKVRAFYQGKTAIEEPNKVASTEENVDLDTFLPLTDVHAPQTLRRKIFLERLDQVLPDLLRTLAGNNEVYAKASLNYTSLRCTAVKALVHTFSLSAKNIIFKTAEWTLVGLVFIKMLSLLDPWLANLLLTKQANMYISMILTSYKLDPHYLNLLVASYNPNVNPR